jgi:hypothetical protein
MASFGRMVPGEWGTTALSWTSLLDTWHWAPGKHSMREMTHGSGAFGEPWRVLRVFYRHPGRKEVCLLGLSPRLKVLEPFLGHTWEAKGNWATGDAFHIQSTFAWVPVRRR